MKKNHSISVLILTEGGRTIGFGHITRCLALCQAFRAIRIQPRFVIYGDRTVQGMLEGEKAEINDWIKHADDIAEKPVDVVIIDSYRASPAVYREIAKRAKIGVYIDDNDRIRYPRGIVVNGNVGAKNIIRKRKSGQRYLLGTRYVPLRSAFWDNPDKRIGNTIESIVITFGGDDLRGLTPRVLETLCRSYPQVRKNVLIGRGFKDISEIVKHKDKKTRIVYFADGKKMRRALSFGDVVITAGGQTVGECASVGIPAIAVCVAGNQKNNIAYFKKRGFIVYAGEYTDPDLMRNLLRGLDGLKTKKIRKEKKAIGRSLIDGSGAREIVKVCLEEYFSRSMVLRKPSVADIRAVFELSNDPAVRKSSFRQDKIPWHDHVLWFGDILKDKGHIFLLAENKNDLVGQVRFFVHKKYASVSISIAKPYRGKHAGIVVLRQGIRYFAEHRPDIAVIKAYIREDNPASVGFFKYAGFSSMRKTILKGQKAFELSYEINR